MSDTQSQKPTAKEIALLILVAVVISVTVTLIQHLVLGRSHVAVTGGVVGALAGVMAIRMVRKKSS
jgi:hypothetical protein